MSVRRIVGLGAVAGGLIAATFALYPYIHGLSFVIRSAGLDGPARRIADLDTVPVRTTVVSIPLTSERSIRARLYQPLTPRRTVLLVSGLHPAGIDEPRLVGLARQLAASNITVVTPDISDLSEFRISPALTDAIERAAVWLAAHHDLSPEGRIGMVGISFSGGLSIVAAGRPSLAGKVAYVFALGGHHDLTRVLAYLCTGVDGDAAAMPHVYGVAVILLGIADRVVPSGQVDEMRAAVRRFLSASALNNVDPSRAAAEFAALRKAAMTMPQPSAALLSYINDGEVAKLGARLLPYIGLYGGDPALSPAKSPKPSVPIFLLHGVDDNIIPSSESTRLAEDFRSDAPVRLLLSRLITHADVNLSMGAEIAKLAAFSADLLGR